MEKAKNPFYLKGYHGSEYFCNRNTERIQLIENAKRWYQHNPFSIRRMGKTGLIHHTFNTLQNNKSWTCIYTDIYATQNLQEFTNQLASSILKAFPSNQTIGKRFMKFVRGLSPSINFDPLMGAPEISFKYVEPKQYEHALKGLFEFLDQQNKHILIAIDEFQQVAQYPEKMLRHYYALLSSP